ncbi:MAG: TMEM14 family protein [Planctomycetia bacterium]|nr:TMEM14 family protein [Planctomycetia bacterium]
MYYPQIGQVILGIYAVLLAVGGVMGFVKARSHASLISGVLSAVFAVVALALMLMKNHNLGATLGAILAVVLFVLFGYRYAIHNRRFMPSGMLALVSLAVLAAMLLTADWTR